MNMPHEFIYVFVNESYPRSVKIGKTTLTPERRAEELSRATGLLHPFLVAYAAEVTNGTEAESRVHNALRDWRDRDDREFFRVKSTKAVHTIMRYCSALLVNDPREPSPEGRPAGEFFRLFSDRLHDMTHLGDVRDGRFDNGGYHAYFVRNAHWQVGPGGRPLVAVCVCWDDITVVHDPWGIGVRVEPVEPEEMAPALAERLRMGRLPRYQRWWPHSREIHLTDEERLDPQLFADRLINEVTNTWNACAATIDTYLETITAR
jgi:hypothetical protein